MKRVDICNRMMSAAIVLSFPLLTAADPKGCQPGGIIAIGMGDGGGEGGSGAGGAQSPGSGASSGGGLSPRSGATALKLNLTATWPATVAVQGDMGTVSLSYALTYSVDSAGTFTGMLKTCQYLIPPIMLSGFGAGAMGIPTNVQEQYIVPNAGWNAAQQPAVPVTGTIGGIAIGSSFTLNPTVVLNGLKQTSQWKDPAVNWPPPSSAPTMPAVPLSDTSDDDGDLKPGITASPRSDMGFFAPRVGLSASAPTADQYYMVFRTEVSLSGASTSVIDGSGSATVNLLNGHVIGCHVADSDAGARDCIPSEFNFLDQNAEVYQTMSGTYLSKQLTSGSGPGGEVTCDDVRSALP